jgi:hypothetical protein
MHSVAKGSRLPASRDRGDGAEVVVVELGRESGASSTLEML